MTDDLTGQFILLCVAVFMVFWTVTAFSTKRTIEGGGWRQGIGIAISLAAFIFFLRAGVITRDIPLWSRTARTGVIADTITFMGLVIALWARTVLGGNWSSGVELKDQHELIQRGPYAYVRHPIYTGVLLMVLGIAIFRGTLMGFIVLAVIFVSLRFKAVQEEKLLTRHFGDAYIQYKDRVPALIPLVW